MEYYHDCVKENLFDDDNIVNKIFSQNSLANELEKIIKAHNSNKTFQVTDYHFLILYDALEQFCDLYNDDIIGKFSFGGIHPSMLDFEQMVGIYFWDTDFLFGQDIINNLLVN